MKLIVFACGLVLLGASRVASAQSAAPAAVAPPSAQAGEAARIESLEKQIQSLQAKLAKTAEPPPRTPAQIIADLQATYKEVYRRAIDQVASVCRATGAKELLVQINPDGRVTTVCPIPIR